VTVRRFEYAEVISAADPAVPLPVPRSISDPIVIRSRKKREPVEDKGDE